VTQPRRVAALATARRVAEELGVKLGEEVGFQVRYDRRVGGEGAIKFMTDGILLREVQVSRSLHGLLEQLQRAALSGQKVSQRW
jgi:HrpA-like RNA helicase